MPVAQLCFSLMINSELGNRQTCSKSLSKKELDSTQDLMILKSLNTVLLKSVKSFELTH